MLIIYFRIRSVARSNWECWKQTSDAALYTKRSTAHVSRFNYQLAINIEIGLEGLLNNSTVSICTKIFQMRPCVYIINLRLILKGFSTLR